MTHRLSVLLLLACVVLPGASLAETLEASVDATKLLWFTQIDADGDELISEEELGAMRTRRFMQVDLNGDQLLTIEEFMHDLSNSDPILSQRRRDRFAMMDDDQNAFVTVREFIDFGTLVMELLDQDGDKLIRLAEFNDGVRYPQ
ncbi:MAG: hypothetical protein WD044_11255 [Dongiaceae bacterium]